MQSDSLLDNTELAPAPAGPAAAAPGTEESDNAIVIPEHTDNWDEYFLWIATVVAIKSKDPRCRVGAVITSPDNVVLSTGFNGLARGVYDNEQILGDADEKLKVICHAEQNAILNAARIGVALQGASIFVTKFPCLACCNAIIQAGINRIYTHDSSFWNDDPFDKDHSRKKSILRQAKVKVDAPYHPEYRPHEQIDPGKRKGPARAKTTADPAKSRSRP